MMNENNDLDLLERIVTLETEKKSHDREIKELKEKVEFISTSLNNQALATQSILSKVDNLTEKFKPVVDFIEELKSKPQKELNKFAWLIVTLVTNAIWGLLLLYIKK
ncbi:hypothetical protein [Clostridium saccharoperbutylacetonicum]|uniref:hypothetical protein n=1 Tax=Clostridium saccharoperbutylacetonicum TaxID=36745 RepID=UPI0039E9E3EB